MCPLYPLHFILTYSLVLTILWVLLKPTLASATSVLGPALRAHLNETILANLHEGKTANVIFFLEDIPEEAVGEILVKVINNF